MSEVRFAFNDRHERCEGPSPDARLKTLSLGDDAVLRFDDGVRVHLAMPESLASRLKQARRARDKADAKARVVEAEMHELVEQYLGSRWPPR